MDGEQANGQKEVNTTDALRDYKNVRVLWPLNCPDDILDATIKEASRLLEEHDIDTEGVQIAEKLKKYMDTNYEQYWHVVCGKHFGCYTIHETMRFIYFYLENIAFMCYKSG